MAYTEDDTFSKYLNRVETFLRLSATKVVGIDDLAAETEGIVVEELEERRLTTGTNILLYGVPGSGKSWTIQHEYCTDDSIVERLVFHPDYTYCFNQSGIPGSPICQVSSRDSVSSQLFSSPSKNFCL